MTTKEKKVNKRDKQSMIDYLIHYYPQFEADIRKASFEDLKITVVNTIDRYGKVYPFPKGQYDYWGIKH